MAKQQQIYQYEPPVVPAQWTGDQRRFALRLLERLDELYALVGRLQTRVKQLEESDVSV